MLENIIKRQAYKKEEGRMFRGLWNRIEQREHRVALVGTLSSIHRLSKFAHAQQLPLLQLRLPLSQISQVAPRLVRLPTSSSTGVDYVLVPDQKNKKEISQRVARALSDDIPVYILPEDILSGKLRLRADGITSRRPRQAPRLSYIIASSRRTGSTMLCNLLRKTGLAGYPSEYIQQRFNMAAEQQHIEASEVLGDALAINQTENQVFGIKVHWSALDDFRTNVLPAFNESARRQFNNLLTGSKYIHLTRANKIRQAISDWRARHSGVFHISLHAKERARQAHRREIPYDYQQLVEHLKGAVEDDRSWEMFFEERGISPLRLVYEEMVASPAAAVRDVLGHLDLPDSNGEATHNTERLADKFTETVYVVPVPTPIEVGAPLLRLLGAEHRPVLRAK